MAVVTPGSFKNGLTIEYKDSVWKVLSFQQTKTARQAAMVRTKLKNLISGTTIDETFRISESLNTALVEKEDALYSYADKEYFNFLDAETYEGVALRRDLVDQADLLRDGMTVQIVKWGDTIVDVVLPQNAEYDVTYTEPGIKKAASSNQLKPATLDTGAEIMVPLYVDIGDKVKVATADRSFVERILNTKRK
eukprot:CAMPEP_0118897754 /NCGR_PEP_ID=MMETSP1166-20130328/5021_1 /TAXON_ID=1104430 /ORGANISM="Chrysoreinhardia sp, Strain CCMP3193" /LENGTH=192 /DNA_ID=CAMNT_0006836833 /DNA_START=108 /DNA_END=686 /DNA_ORIENTATION=+